MRTEEKEKNPKSPKDEKKVAEEEAPELTSEQKEDVLTDFRTVVETGPAEKVGTGTAERGDAVEPPQIKPLNPANRLVIRCIACGHFLFEVIAERSYQKALCRQAECKALNEVTVQGSSVMITDTRREERERGTMRL